jgi:hypothetical protein
MERSCTCCLQAVYLLKYQILWYVTPYRLVISQNTWIRSSGVVLTCLEQCVPSVFFSSDSNTYGEHIFNILWLLLRGYYISWLLWNSHILIFTILSSIWLLRNWKCIIRSTSGFIPIKIVRLFGRRYWIVVFSLIISIACIGPDRPAYAVFQLLRVTIRSFYVHRHGCWFYSIIVFG